MSWSSNIACIFQGIASSVYQERFNATFVWCGGLRDECILKIISQFRVNYASKGVIAVFSSLLEAFFSKSGFCHEVKRSSGFLCKQIIAKQFSFVWSQFHTKTLKFLHAQDIRCLNVTAVVCMVLILVWRTETGRGGHPWLKLNATPFGMLLHLV